MSNDLQTLEVVSVHSSKAISISDSHSNHSPLFVRYLYKSEPQQSNGTYDAISLSSQNTLRCPVSWSQVRKPKNLLPSHVQPYTPTSQTKVSSWLQDAKSHIMVRHDFGKDFTISKCNSTSPNYNVATVTQRSNVPSSKHNVYNISTGVSPASKSTTSKFEIDPTAANSPKVPPLASVNYVHSKEFHNIFVNNGEAKPVPKHNLEASAMPLSPESQKKRELCSYLQLMNMDTSTKKEKTTMQNRRSIRVKNYMLLTEKKELERKLNSETQNEENTPEMLKSVSPTSSTCSSIIKLPVEESGVSLSKKSFKELEMDVPTNFCQKDLDKKLQAIENISAEADTCNLSEFFPKNLTEKQENFEETIKKFFVSERIDFEKDNTPKQKKCVKKCDTQKLVRHKVQKDKTHFDKSKNKENMIKRQKYKTKKLMNQVSKIFKTNHKKKKLKQLMNAKKFKTKNGRTKKNTLNTLRSHNNSVRALFRQPVRRNRSLRSTDSLEHIGLKTILDKSLKMQKRTQKKREIKEQNEVRENAHKEKRKTPVEPKKDEPAAVANKEETMRENVLQQALMDHDYMLLDEEVVEKEGPESPLANRPSKTIDAKNSTTKTSGSENVIHNGANNNTLISPCLGFDPTSRSNSLVKIDTIINGLHSNVAETHPQETSTSKTDSSKESKQELVDSSRVSPRNGAYVPLNKQVKTKSLHRNLIPNRSLRKRLNFNAGNDVEDADDWDLCSTPSGRNQKSEKRNAQSHSIDICNENGVVLKAYYVDFNLIIAQEFTVSFWSQSALGNVLGAQNMWIPKGQINRLVLDNGCVHKSSSEMVLSSENSVAYVELWTKEHKSDKRERPVADVFATVYFCKQRQNGVFKKVLQLENINGYATDVQYVVLTNSRSIVVSWNVKSQDTRTTVIHCYQFAPDFQTVATIRQVESVNHYVSTLHNIQGCDDLIVGWGENKITLWNLEYGYVVATVELMETVVPLHTLWVKCDRGFLFILQQLENGNLCLIAINGINHSWKRLQTYVPPNGYSKLRGVCVENGILVAFYDTGILCWNVQTGELRVEETSKDTLFIPSGKHVVMITNEQILVRHALAYLITYDEA